MSEKIYDEKVAPKLAEIARLCQEYGLPFVACVEYEPGHLGETRILKNATFVSLLVVLAMLERAAKIE